MARASRFGVIRIGRREANLRGLGEAENAERVRADEQGRDPQVRQPTEETTAA